RALLPILPMTLHPGVLRLAELFVDASPKRRRGQSKSLAHASGPEPAPSGAASRMLEMEVWSTEEALLEAGGTAPRPGLPGWDVLRFLGGEIAEIFLHTAHAEIRAGEPLLIS